MEKYLLDQNISSKDLPLESTSITASLLKDFDKLNVEEIVENIKNSGINEKLEQAREELKNFTSNSISDVDLSKTLVEQDKVSEAQLKKMRASAKQFKNSSRHKALLAKMEKLTTAQVYPNYKTIKNKKLAYGSKELEEILSKLNMNIATAQILNQRAETQIKIQGLSRFEPQLFLSKVSVLPKNLDFSEGNNFLKINLVNCHYNQAYLRKLKLPNTGIRQLPNNLGLFLSYLGEIDVSGNHLETIPDNLFQIPGGLISLNASNNKLSKISPYIIYSTLLEELYMANNNLDSLPLEVLKTRIKKIDVSDNKLTKLFDWDSGSIMNKYFYRAEEHAKIKFPEEYEKIVADGKLESELQLYKDISFYCPQELELFVASLGQSLEYLDISNNKLQFLPLDICFFSKLKYLNLDGNPWSYLPNSDKFRKILENTNNQKHIELTYKTESVI